MPAAVTPPLTEGPPSPLAAALPPGTLEAVHLETASKILEIIARYRIRQRDVAAKSQHGTLGFLAQVYTMVVAGAPIEMCLPAFPFKSPNSRSKVLGRLPDKAEEFALANLNGLCAAIGDVYPAGAKLMIISDGLVYNDLLGVPDQHVWAYGEALRQMSTVKGFNHIQFSRLRDLVHISVPDELDEMSYVANATNFRHALFQQFSSPDYDVSAKIAEHSDTCLTYRGYIKFLETDLEDVFPQGPGRSKSKYKKGIEMIAKQMLKRGDAFARAVREKFSGHVRLSIHPSVGNTKISISPLPTDSAFTTPWHASIAFALDGTVTTGHRATFEADPRYELVEVDGRPSFFRETTELLKWGTSGGGIVCEPLYPSGWLIRPAGGPGALSMADVDAPKVRALAERNSPVVLRDFSGTTNREAYIAKASEFGTPLPWKFGLLLEVKDRGVDTRGLNNVLSAEWMPWHFDGLFKTDKKTREDGTEYLVPNPPKFQFFTSVTESPADTGFTLFATSTLILKHLTQQFPLDYLRTLTWEVSTSSFNASSMGAIPLIMDHPTTGQPCIRYHEPWPATKTKFDATHVAIENPGPEGPTSAAFCEAVDSILHDRRVAYWHSWKKGDLIISDNVLNMHTRSDFTAGAGRELWRIHFD